MTLLVFPCRGCALREAVRHRADLCEECQAKAGDPLIDAYIDASMKLRAGRFTPGEFEKASHALWRALA